MEMKTAKRKYTFDDWLESRINEMVQFDKSGPETIPLEFLYRMEKLDLQTLKEINQHQKWAFDRYVEMNFEGWKKLINLDLDKAFDKRKFKESVIKRIEAEINTNLRDYEYAMLKKAYVNITGPDYQKIKSYYEQKKDPVFPLNIPQEDLFNIRMHIIDKQLAYLKNSKISKRFSSKEVIGKKYEEFFLNEDLKNDVEKILKRDNYLDEDYSKWIDKPTKIIALIHVLNNRGIIVGSIDEIPNQINIFCRHYNLKIGTSKIPGGDISDRSFTNPPKVEYYLEFQEKFKNLKISE
ncbi:MAG: hypothetical protein JXB19_04725 [Bacteroidales bacterium]|nr:hypothetical protein [Bacteroidales bacterium]